MREHSSTYGIDDPYAGTERSGGALRRIAMVGAIALIATPAIARFMRRRREAQTTAMTEPAIDKTLKDTFPASDPPASRYFDIPVNRR